MVTPQFHVFRNPYADSAEAAPFLVVLQSENFTPSRTTVVVAPLVDEKHVAALLVFRPRFKIEGRTYSLNMLQIGAMPTADLGASGAALDRYRVISGSSI